VKTSIQKWGMQIKLRKVRNSIGSTFPKEILEKFNLSEGDELTLAAMEDGLKLMPDDSEGDSAPDEYDSCTARSSLLKGNGPMNYAIILFITIVELDHNDSDICWHI
jgi:antitoxin component of MazEF toxin-antitoxin module